MARVLLIGQPASGKTSMVKIMLNEDPPTTHIPTQKSEEHEACDGGFCNFGNTTIRDTGGNGVNKIDTCANYLVEYMLEDDYVFYVFNGNEFLKELDNSYKGGPIGAELRSLAVKIFHWYKGLLSSWEQCLKPNFWFVATFSDKCSGDMKEIILQKMEQVQSNYKDYGSRYFFYKQMVNTLHCINATDRNQVKNLFKEINPQ